MGDPADRSNLQIAVLREPPSRGGSAFIHDSVSVRDRLRVRGPRNHFEVRPAGHYLFIAGGIGITLIIPMLRQANAAGADWSLVYGGRAKRGMAFADEVTLEYPGKVRLVPQDERGLIDLPGLLGTARADTLVYCCGPEPLLDAVEEKCASWPEGSLVVERFAPKEVEPAAGSLDTFEVECRRSGLTLTVGPDETMLDVLLDAGVDWPSSCEEGT